MTKFTPLALLCGLAFTFGLVGCDSVEEERAETNEEIADAYDDGVVDEDDAEDIANEREETIDQVQDEMDNDDGVYVGDGDLDGDVDADLDNDLDGDAEPVLGSDGL